MAPPIQTLDIRHHQSINVFDIDIVLHDLCFGFCLTQVRPGNQIISWINLRLQSIVEALWDIIPILLETP